MTLSKSNLPLEFPQPTKINTLVCCDLDETYIPYSIENKKNGGIKDLEKFMLEKGHKKGIFIGWITGTNLSSALRKANNYISYSPHFLCCSLGTEFYWIKNGKLIPSESWKDRIIKSGFSHENVNIILEKISKKGVLLQKQP
ncbi:HAD family hydrolase, partial [Rodentibacter ratti]